MASVPSFLTGPLERVDPLAGGTQVLVITPDSETALGIAEAVLRMTGPAGIELLPVTSARRAGRLMAGRPVLAAAGSPRDIRDLVRGTQLKLDGVSAVVLAWADEILAGEAEDIEALESVMSELPKDAARIVVTSRSEGRVNAFAERYLRRAHRDVPADEEDAAPVAVQYVTVSPTSRGTALRRLLDDMDPPSAAIVVADDESEQSVAKTLKLLGYTTRNAPVRVTRGEIEPSTYAVIFFDIPASRSALAAAAAASPVAIVALAEPREVAALRRMAAGGVKPFTLASSGDAARDRDVAMRRELTSVIESGVATREMLSLEPLLERHDGIEIAAAALRLLERERTLRKAAQDEVRAQRDTPPSAPVSRSAPGADRGAPSRDRRPPSGGSREGGRGFVRGGDRPPPSREGGRGERPFRESRGPRDSAGSRGAPPRGGERPSRDSQSRPPRRDRP
ncbi:MAG: hypothetical protein ABI556_02430 [Gemmatimonadales bacterium]